MAWADPSSLSNTMDILQGHYPQSAERKLIPKKIFYHWNFASSPNFSQHTSPRRMPLRRIPPVRNNPDWNLSEVCEILTNGIRRNLAKSDRILSFFYGFFRGFRWYPDRNPLVRNPVKYGWVPIGCALKPSNSAEIRYWIRSFPVGPTGRIESPGYADAIYVILLIEWDRCIM